MTSDLSVSLSVPEIRYFTIYTEDHSMLGSVVLHYSVMLMVVQYIISFALVLIQGVEK